MGLRGILAMNKILIYDSTLRDGAQAQGISFSVEDKIKLVDKLDKLGVNYIEAGNPGSNPKDLEFFDRIKNIKFRNAKVIAFGSTRRVNSSADEDANVNSLLMADTPAVAIFGKSWDFHVTDILKTTLDENLKMIYDTILFFKNKNKEACTHCKFSAVCGFDCKIDGYRYRKLKPLTGDEVWQLIDEKGDEEDGEHVVDTTTEESN